MIPKNVNTQVDFVGGQIDAVALRRDDQKIALQSVKLARNARPLPTGQTETRFGRRLISVGNKREDDIRVKTGVRYNLGFSAGILTVSTRAGVVLKTFTSLPWTDGEVFSIRWDQFDQRIFICLAGMRTKVVTAIGLPAAWTIGDFDWGVALNGTLQQPYWRFADLNVTLDASAFSGTGVTLTASAASFVAGHVGQRIRYYGREILITAFTSTTVLTGTIIEPLPIPFTYEAASPQDFAQFSVGDQVGFKLSPTRGVVSAITGGNSVITVVPEEGSFVNVASGQVFEEIVGPNARVKVSNLAYLSAPEPIAEWDEPAISVLRGWPASVTCDLSRVCFHQIPALPDAILWSAINAWNDFEVIEDGAIFERVLGELRVLDVAPGPDIFVLTDSQVFYIPISADNPLKLGSVEFRPIDEKGISATVRAVSTGNAVLFVDSGDMGVWGIIQTGQTARPYLLRELTERCRSLINTPVTLAYQTGESDNPEQFAYCVMGDGTMIAGRFDPLLENVGWFPWDGVAPITWVSARTTGALLNSAYALGLNQPFCEEIISTALTDSEVDPITPGASLDVGKPSGWGPLWMFAGGTVRLRNGSRDYGDRAVSNVGYLVTLDNDDVVAGYRVGLAFTHEVSPFVWHVPGGPSKQQRGRRRKLARSVWTVQRDCGFEVEDDNTRQGRPAHQTRDDQSVAAPTRLESHRFRHRGRTFDPSVTIRQTSAGRLTLIEFSPEVTV